VTAFQVLFVLTCMSRGVEGIVCRCVCEMWRLFRICSKDVSWCWEVIGVCLL
jgi:hypothetical protein